MKPFLVALLLAGTIFGSDIASDRTGVHNAAKDYVDALYEAKPDLIARSVHPQLAKRGFYLNDKSAFQESTMTFDQLHKLAARWNEGGKRDLSKSPREVVVGEVMDQIATAKVVADWGIDYMQLAKYDGQWKIVNIVWQSHPKRAGAGAPHKTQ
jgi:hypothetical protein